jgi:multiple sugar transport system substrate-binding protein
VFETEQNSSKLAGTRRGEEMKRALVSLLMLLLAGTFLLAEQITVTWWKAPQTENEGDGWKPLIAQFEKENPGIKIEYTATTWEGWLEKHIPAYISGTPPDVCFISSDFFPTLAHEGFLQALQEIDPAFVGQMKGYIYPRSLEAASYNGKVMGVPQDMNHLFLIYNKDLFKKAGLDPNKPPETWDDVMAYGKKIMASGLVKYAVGWPATPPRMAGLWSLGWIYSAGAELVTEDLLHSRVTEPAMVKAFDFMKDLETKYKIAAPATTYSSSEVTNMFFQQQTAMMLFEAPSANIARKYLPAGAVGVSHWPVANKEQLAKGEIYNRGWNECEAVARVSKNKAAALKWAKFLGSPVAIKWWCETGFMTPPRKDVVLKADPLMEQVIAMAPYVKYDPPSIFAPRLQYVLGDAINAVLVGQTSTAQALKQLNEEINGFLTGN